MTRSVALCLSTLLALLALGCGSDSCDTDEISHCDGNFVVSCSSGVRTSVPYESRIDCGTQMCIETSDRAFCASSREPDERCKAGERQVFCDEQRIVKCGADDYLFLTETCSEEQVCVESEDPPDASCGPKSPTE